MRKSLPAVLVAVAVTATAVGTALVLPKGTPSSAAAQQRTTPSAPSLQTPAPHILDFARGLHAAPKSLPASGRPVAQALGSDGCDHAYGAANVCVPWTFPRGVATSTTARCDWLQAHGLKAPIPVHGRDRLGLDRNRDGFACGVGDPPSP